MAGRGRGQPTKYKDEYCQAIIDYFDRPPQQTVYKETFYADGTLKSKDPVIIPIEFPTMEGFAASINIHKDTLYEWVKVHKNFSDAFTRARQLQEKIWLVNSLGKLYDSQFAQFFGKNCLGYKDKTVTELSGKVEQGLSDADRALLSKVADRIKDK